MMVAVRDARYRVHGTVHPDEKPVLMMLHGFTGSGAVFAHLSTTFGSMVRMICPDLCGHGETRVPEKEERYHYSAQCEDLAALIRHFTKQPVILHGYSMGGRLALRFALAYPDLVAALILESTHPGMQDAADRRARATEDDKRANAIRKDYPAFLQAWNRLPLLRPAPGAPDGPAENFLEIQKKQHPESLARSVRAFGAAAMDPVHQALSQSPLPILVITGSLDTAYTALWKRLTPSIPRAEHTIIQQAGHRVHLDRPDAYIEAVKPFINQHYTQL